MWLERNLFPYFRWYQHSHSDSWWTLPYGHSFLFEYYLMHATCWCEVFIHAEYYKCFLALINRLLSPHSFGNLSVCTTLMTTLPKSFPRFIISNPSSADSNPWRTCAKIGTTRRFSMNLVVSSKSLWESGWTRQLECRFKLHDEGQTFVHSKLNLGPTHPSQVALPIGYSRIFGLHRNALSYWQPLYIDYCRVHTQLT